MTQLSKAMNWIGFLMLAGCLGLLIYFWRWASTDVVVMELYHTPVRVANQDREIDQGEPLIYTLEYCKYVDASATLIRELIADDGRRLAIPLPVTGSTLPMGCHEIQKVEIISGQIPPGTYRLRITRVYGARTLVDSPLYFETEPFAVR